MATTTFCDIKLKEDVEGYVFENKERNFEKGQVISLPRHTAQKFVNKWDYAEWENADYEVRDDEYDDVVCRVRGQNKDAEICGAEKSDGEICMRDKPCPYHDE